MGKRSKSRPGYQSNAPDFRIFQQPPHNPYYPDPSASLLSASASAPPPYSDLTAPNTSTSRHYPNAVTMSQVNNSASSISYPRIHASDSGHVPIVIHQSVTHDRRVERFNHKVRSFNNQTMLIAVLATVLSLWAFNLYDSRPCAYNFTVHKPSKDVTISIKTVRDSHLTVAYLSIVIVLLTLAKSCTGYKDKSYPCYMFVMTLLSFMAACFTGYLAYLALYSPCAMKVSELLANAGKTVLGSLIDKLPAPEEGVFGEQNVLALAKEDQNGVVIFLFDTLNFITYASVFLSSICLC